MRVRVPYDETVPEYYGKIPRTVEEAFGPHSTLTLPGEDFDYTRPRIRKPSKKELRVATLLLAMLAGFLLLSTLIHR